MFNCAKKLLLASLLPVLAIAATSSAQENAPQQQPQQEKPKIAWQQGPTTGVLGDIAQITVPQGFAFTDKTGAQQLLVLTHNIPSGRELGALVSAERDSSWFMIFEFDDTGYVKDDEKDKLDADVLLKNMKQATEEGNEERQKPRRSASPSLRPPGVSPQPTTRGLRLQCWD